MKDTIYSIIILLTLIAGIAIGWNLAYKITTKEYVIKLNSCVWEMMNK